MKKLMLGAALAAATFTTPAFAQLLDIQIGPREREYIVREGRSVTYDGPIAVGTVLPADVEFYTVPEVTTYRYAVVNDRRVIVEPSSRRIIQIVE
ncbi:hypothetical protein IZ6_05320 [Terrihabitans soli]|uniref:DUF1236 domain-containing protein n=1 Tax=Terrihabitans soli TaxID=708113 RepID=A0A6S6QPE6_9HYPH|nr:DUF1236 domain-containing protein [Terrihabitans soli]BCJ89797.1 hypothetical protein IZ6_05320 [Terrihabitans soli]